MQISLEKTNLISSVIHVLSYFCFVIDIIVQLLIAVVFLINNNSV